MVRNHKFPRVPAQEKSKRCSGVGHMNMYQIGGTTADGGQQTWANRHRCDGAEPGDAGHVHAFDCATFIPPGRVGSDHADVSRFGLPGSQTAEVCFDTAGVRRIEFTDM